MIVDELVIRARRLVAAPGRRLLGITGPPGAGKSTLAAALADALNANQAANQASDQAADQASDQASDQAIVVGMDGFHLADAELVRLGRRDRKGAPDTFDGHGYLALLQRLRAANEPVTYAPLFRREIEDSEDSIAAAVPVAQRLPLVITEGNYLLLAGEPWCRLRRVLDEIWYLDPPWQVRIDRLIARHVAHGKSLHDARAWTLDRDERNAELIAVDKRRADLLIQLEG